MSDTVEFGGALNTIEFEGKVYDSRHGGPFDRGSADSYYSRPSEPHFYLAGTSTSPRVSLSEMTAEDVEAYLAGYRFNDQYGDKKNWD
jgi:hypothetical protein